VGDLLSWVSRCIRSRSGGRVLRQAIGVFAMISITVPARALAALVERAERGVPWNQHEADKAALLVREIAAKGLVQEWQGMGGDKAVRVAADGDDSGW